MKELFIRARDLIKEGRLQEARNILTYLDHPLATEWINKIDALGWQATPSAQHYKSIRDDDVNLPAGKPWNPYGTAFGVLLFLTWAIIPALILSYNWRKLGKSRWIIPTVLLAIVLPIGLVALLVASFRLIDRFDPTPPMLPLLGAVVFLVLNFAFPILLAELQNGGYMAWQERGVQAMLTHKYTIGTKRLLIGGGIALCIIVGLMVMLYYELKPTVFTHPYLSMIYPSEWDETSTILWDYCQQSDYECVVALTEDGYAPATITIIHYPMTQPLTAQEWEQNAWDYWGTSDDGIQRPDERTLEDDVIDGEPAVIRYVRLPDPFNEGETLYEWDIFVVHNNSMFVITITTNCLGCYRESRVTIERIYRSIDFLSTDL